MKAGITGHTRGLGKAIETELHRKGVETMGFSRTNGFDISDPKSRERILDEVKDCDIFFNNAYSGYSQLDLTYEFYSRYKDQAKTFVTTGSIAANAVEWRLQPCLYSVIKKALDNATYQLTNSHDKSDDFNLMIFKPGYLNTDMIDYHDVSAWSDKESVAKNLVSLLLTQKDFTIPEIVMRPITQDVRK
jgi:NAD(P)-dependent dehydrogenase (short-subunit alcohol dehydrogenase family)